MNISKNVTGNEQHSN